MVMVWSGLDVETAVKRLRLLAIPFAVPFLAAVIYVAHQNLLLHSFRFVTWYGVFRYTPRGLEYFGELVFPVVTGAAVLMGIVFVFSLPPVLLVGPFADFFMRPFKGRRGFESFGRVCGAVRSFTARGSRKEKLLLTVLILSVALALLSLSLAFLSWLGIVSVNMDISRLLLLLFASNYIVSLFCGVKIEQALQKHAETVKT